MYTLPTEAQWEYACRAGSTTRYSFGDDASNLNDYAWWGCLYGNASPKYELYAHQVGQKNANPWGFCDMHGNAPEWCRDSYQEKLIGGSDPEVMAGGPKRVVRGGDWRQKADSSRSASRSGFHPSEPFFGPGFRVALTRVK